MNSLVSRFSCARQCHSRPMIKMRSGFSCRAKAGGGHATTSPIIARRYSSSAISSAIPARRPRVKRTDQPARMLCRCRLWSCAAAPLTVPGDKCGGCNPARQKICTRVLVLSCSRCHRYTVSDPAYPRTPHPAPRPGPRRRARAPPPATRERRRATGPWTGPTAARPDATRHSHSGQAVRPAIPCAALRLLRSCRNKVDCIPCPKAK